MRHARIELSAGFVQ